MYRPCVHLIEAQACADMADGVEQCHGQQCQEEALVHLWCRLYPQHPHEDHEQATGRYMCHAGSTGTGRVGL